MFDMRLKIIYIKPNIAMKYFEANTNTYTFITPVL